MKRLFYCLLGTALLLSSCSSDQPGLMPDIDPTPSSKDRIISIDLSGVKEFTEVRAGGTPKSLLEAGVKHVHYFVFNEADGKAVKYREYYKEGNVTIKDTLPDGKYRIALVASNYEDKIILGAGIGYDFISSATLLPRSTYNRISEWNYNEFFLAYFNPSQNLEFFYNDFVLDVNSNTETSTIVLERITNKVEIIPTDIDLMPNWVEEVSFSVYYASYQHFRFKTRKADINEYIAVVMPVATLTKDEFKLVNENNPIVSTWLAVGEQTEFPIRVSISGGSNRDFVIKQSYNLQPNQILRLKGKLFSQDVENGEIVVDTEWGETTEENFD
ncbi:MAG: FimB/Mfa2 family fimbrial subunit [Dysgonomonas sp.]|nr:FimB/Mfa2 family fimbrial subunit [Dysgonomonas sp.]